VIRLLGDKGFQGGFHHEGIQGFLSTTGVAFCGLITSVLTAILVVVGQKLLEINIFTFMIWLIVPAGAVATGMAAASGYYFGSLYFHTRPGALLLIQMVLIAGLTQLLIYYLEYSTFILDDGRRLSDYLPFTSYLDITLTKAQYRVGRGATTTFEAGEMGYGIALLQFCGFLVGGFSAFAILKNKPVCSTCNKYFRPLASVTKQFAEHDKFSTYYDGLFQIPVTSPLFGDALRAETEKIKARKGTINHKISLVGCPECKDQALIEDVQVFSGSEWKDVRQLHRRTLLPKDVNLIPVLRRS
jgi:hypothetical protein